MDAPIFSHSIETVAVGDLTFRLCLIKDLDEALDYYVKTSPSDTDKIPYFTHLWESARVLAGHLVSHPGLCRGKRVLELGCGLGLPSLCASALGAAAVTASDFHPDNRAFFLRNAELNGLTNIDYHPMDWRNPDLDTQFETILGSDLIYEKQMVEPLAHCAANLLAPQGAFLLADPGRTALQNAVNAMENLGFAWELITVDDIWLLKFTRKDNAPT
jgi:predicted nicotinamide N-methyase